MSDGRIGERWRRLREARRVALIPYVTAGFPTRDASLAALRMLEARGADFVEVGIPFSDPLADGPVIQRSTQQALDAGMTVAGMLELVREADLSIPVIAFGYLNPLLAYGLERFLANACDAGVSGLLLTDLPVGEDAGLETTLRQSGLARIPLVAPTTTDDRLSRTLAGAQGFVYLIARLGVTGAPTDLDDAVAATVTRVRAATTLPIALGFGIGSGPQAAVAARFADGVVVGSALVERLADGVAAAAELVDELRAAIDQTAAAGSV